MVALGGDRGNTVPKPGVTAAEIAALRAIHGNESVFDIEPAGAVVRRNSDERLRLVETYRARNSDGKSIVGEMFPGAAARVFETLDELELPEEFFKTETRKTSKSAAVVAKGKAKKAAEAPAAGGAAAVVTAAAGEVENDGIGDL